MPDVQIKDPYLVKPGDTMSSIAIKSGQTVSTLAHLNGIKNLNQLEAGQTLYLSKNTAFSVRVLFLDVLRHPIENLPYQITYDDQTLTGKTGANGMAQKFITKNAQSKVVISAPDLHGRMCVLRDAVSGYGQKQITLLSGAIVFPGKTAEHPTDAPTTPVPHAAPPAPTPAGHQPPAPPPASGTPIKPKHPVHTKKHKGPQGQEVIKVTVDMPAGLIALFQHYTGAVITEHDWDGTARQLQCEIEVLKAIADVEGGGNASFWQLNDGKGAHVPHLLYECHIFSRLTGHKYDDTHLDISSRTPYHTYGTHAQSYLRLVNAYQLDQDAALQACSWGKFQVLGENHALCKEDSAQKLVAKMCTSEVEQLNLLRNFIELKKDRVDHHGKYDTLLWNAVKAKDWPNIARYYNGPGYKKFAYDTKLKEAYEQEKRKQQTA